MEICKDIKGYEGLYQVSNFGNIKSLRNKKTRKEKIKRTRIGKNGYVRVDLFKNGKGKTFFVHRLVAQAFIPNPQNLKEINHIDEKTSNNIVDNLEWCDRKYNINYGDRTQKCIEKLKGVNAKRIKQYDKTGKFICMWNSMSEASQKLNISQGSISRCCNGKSNIAGGYKWHF